MNATQIAIIKKFSNQETEVLAREYSTVQLNKFYIFIFGRKPKLYYTKRDIIRRIKLAKACIKKQP